ncbi:unnamed protein product [Acanthoscelides obtectus]|nr:unnamed protein product [Acanthoscelides obtectus]CAK1638800.1 hypothetical protein AOBTE_LOCUS10825 [Acanthoscelides obtectus]
MELPLYQPNTQPNVHQSGKRVKNINCSTNTKRAKCDYPQSKPSPAKEEFEPLKSKDYSHIQNSETPNINNSFNTTTASPESEAKEPLNMKVTWFGSESSIGDQSLGEQAAIGFSTYILEVCCFSITICIPNVNLLLTYRRSSPVFGIRYKYITSSGGQMSSMICKCF